MPEFAERPKIADAPLSVVLIHSHAGADVPEIIRSWSALLKGLSRDHEIVVVDDGAGMDADALRAEFPDIRLLHHDSKRGLGAALRSGIAAAQQPLLFYTSCDRQYQPHDFEKLLEQIDKVDLVTGYRKWLAIPRWYKLWRGIASVFCKLLFSIDLERTECWLGREGRGRRRLARWLLRVLVQDSECVYRLCRRSIFERIPIQSDGIFSQIEILAKTNFLGLYVSEVPVSYSPLPDAVPEPSQQTRRDIWQVLTTPEFGPYERGMNGLGGGGRKYGGIEPGPGP